LRLTEALALDWHSPPVLVNLATHPPQILFYAEGQKSRRDEAVPMTPELAAFLARHPRRQRTGPVIRLKTGRDRFVAGKLVSACGRLARISVNAAGKPASAHDLRRSFGTRLAPRVRPLTLQKLMRHATLETTLRYYVSLSSADAAEELWRRPAAAAPKRPRPVPKKVPKKDVRSPKRGRRK
jgi:integrase